MNPNCRCGGRFESLDPAKALPNGLVTQIRIAPGHATWKCNKCGTYQRQRLRKPKSKPEATD